MNTQNFKQGQTIKFIKSNDSIIKTGIDYTIETVGEDYIHIRNLSTKGATIATFSNLKFMQYAQN